MTKPMKRRKVTIKIGKKNKRKRVPKARAVWCRHNGKSIGKGYSIHHIDGDPSNDDIVNLLRLRRKDHNMLHRKLEQYARGKPFEGRGRRSGGSGKNEWESDKVIALCKARLKELEKGE